jgi:predicted XRE-type DNA-binding protein
MSGVKVKYKVDFNEGKPRCSPRRSKLFQGESGGAVPDSKPISRIARMLALAHFIERQVEAGAMVDYAEAARLLGITRSRVSQVMNLLTLSPSIQVAILSGKYEASERQLRSVLKSVDWKEQRT